MKQLNKHTISLLLIISSIALLVVFQFFWLQKVYQEQRTWLQKEVNNLFRDAIANLQDSIIQSKFIYSKDSCENLAFRFDSAMPQRDVDLQGTEASMVLLQNDTSFMRMPMTTGDSLPKTDGKINLTISAKSNDGGTIRMRSSLEHFPNRARAFLSAIKADSIRTIYVSKALRQVILNVGHPNGNQDFVLKLGEDSLSVSSVQQAFAKSLKTAALPVAFQLEKWQIPHQGDTFSAKELVVGPVPAGFPPREVFAATLSHYENYLFRKMIPQVLFSIFLVGITAIAFWLVHRSLRQQQRLTQLKNDFISNVTHELKTPIATVSVAIEALSSFNALENPQLTKEYLDISKNELDRLGILVDKVLKMSIFEQQEPELRLEVFDLKGMIHQILASMKLQFEKYGAQVHFDTRGEDFTIQADQTHLTSVLYNLIDNALKYSRENPEINIWLEQQNDQLHLAVADKGIGISPEYKDRIFDKFFRVPTGDIHNVKGHGLGLNYVASVVRKHGGRIEVASEPSAGSCFTVYLPKQMLLLTN